MLIEKLLICSFFLFQNLESRRQVSSLSDGLAKISGRISADDPLSVPENNVYFHYGDLKFGAEIPIYFSRKDPSRFLSRDESETIPFSSGKISEILEFFRIPANSSRAAAVNATLRHCEAAALPGETKFCVSTLESLLDSVVRTFGSSSGLRTLTTDLISEEISVLQNYTIIHAPTVIATEMVVGCHVMPYPYTVFYCHAQAGDTTAYKVNLVGSDGGHVEAAAVCHMDTSQWDPLHVAFRVLKMSPGESPACHFFPGHDLVWVKSSHDQLKEGEG